MDNLIAIIGILGLVFIVAIVMAFPTMLLWNNALVGAIVGVNEIGFWQAMGINILASILFKPNVSKD